MYYFKQYFVLYFCEYTHFTFFTPGPNVSIIAHISQYCTLYMISQHQFADGAQAAAAAIVGRPAAVGPGELELLAEGAAA